MKRFEVKYKRGKIIGATIVVYVTARTKPLACEAVRIYSADLGEEDVKILSAREIQATLFVTAEGLVMKRTINGPKGIGKVTGR